MCKNVRSLADDLQVVRECQRHQSQVSHIFILTHGQAHSSKSTLPPFSLSSHTP